MSAVLCVSDDLTGAVACAAELRRAGLRALVQAWDGPAHGECDALVLDTASRLVDAEEAARRVGAAVGRVGGARIYKRIDSGLRGNVASELAAVPQPCVVAPAAPAYGVTTANGLQLVGGRPVTESRYADGGEAPASARVADGLPGESTELPLEVVRSGALAEALAAASGFVVCDAESPADLSAIASAAATAPVTVAGSYGLAGPYGAALCAGAPPAAPILVVSASRQRATARQLQLAAHEAVVVTGGSADEVARRAAAAVAGSAPRGVVVIGGETASALARTCAVDAVEIESEPWPATPVVRFRGGALDGLRGVVKSGALGDDAWLLYAIGLLRA